MELSELKSKITDAFTGDSSSLREVLELVEIDKAFFPFNEYEYLISSLIEKGGLTYQSYLDIRAQYNRANRNLWLFEISAPRAFGSFAETYVMGMNSKFAYPSKKLDKDYSGQYDLWLDGIRIEVKASRVVDSDSDAPLYMKALKRDTQKNFWMNFQQLKPDCCDVFVWVAVFRDEFVVWVMNAVEVLTHPDYSNGQHRGNTGNEGQLHIKQDNITSLDQYKLESANIEDKIRGAFKRLKR